MKCLKFSFFANNDPQTVIYIYIRTLEKVREFIILIMLYMQINMVT